MTEFKIVAAASLAFLALNGAIALAQTLHLLF